MHIVFHTCTKFRLDTIYRCIYRYDDSSELRVAAVVMWWCGGVVVRPVGRVRHPDMCVVVYIRRDWCAVQSTVLYEEERRMT